MQSYKLIQTLTTGKPARYSVDGKRVSKETYEYISTRTHTYGRMECISTMAWPIDNGGIKRKNYSIARF